jgi:predicted TIM-barrel fold metal-dependent hydrolase
MREFQGFDLDALLRNSYINWCGIPWDASAGSRQNLSEKLRFNSFFTWLQKSLSQLYHRDEPLSATNWEAWSDAIRKAYKDPSHCNEVLSVNCGYRTSILDAYWDPGSNNDLPSQFTPTYRVNAFFFGYSTAAADHDGNNPYVLYPRGFIRDLDEYLAWVRDTILRHKASRCVALKIPIAYDRGLDFCDVPAEAARAAFSRLTSASPEELDRDASRSFPANAPAPFAAGPASGADGEDVKVFQDHLFFQICRMAADANLPVQVHTGMGRGIRTNALQLQEAIQKLPETRFVLLHCSYPWIEDMSLLVTNYPNVHADLSWVPLISTQAAATLVHELIERASIDRIAWGCDTWTPEESYGSLLAFCHVLASALAKKIADGYCSSRDAFRIVDHILFDNPHQLYESH